MKSSIALVLAAVLAVSGCSNMNEEQRGTAQGAGIGAVLGAATGGGGGGRTAAGAALGAAAGAVAGNVWTKRMENQKRQMQQATQGTGVQVTQTADNRLKLDIPSDISFDTARADIRPDFRSVLDKMAESMRENPGTSVTIVGHTDSTGSDAYNNQLSLLRAEHVRDYLAARGIDPSRVAVSGHGESEPVASNATEDGRARNRRVEIFLADKQSTGSSSVGQ
jgi:outer membrane protein OmpA-like peptidoglycan-associated protein